VQIKERAKKEATLVINMGDFGILFAFIFPRVYL
jgi:hypothetical protein